MSEIAVEVRGAFSSLVSRLSPENLCCDGEISRAEVQRRHRQIIKEWRELEVKVGRKVSEDEVYAWEIAEREARRQGITK